jgi:GTP-binding protein HflX
MTRASVLQADMLFATLDPTLRAIVLPSGLKIILSDTVGFISDLPTMLVAAFRATLEEVIEADVILHVRDVSHEDTEAQSRDVAEVLDALGIDPGDEQRLIEVWNKIDRLDADGRTRLQNLAGRSPAGQHPILVSALTGEGTDGLFKAIEERLGTRRVVLSLALDPADGAGVSWLHRNSEVMDKSLDRTATGHDSAGRSDTGGESEGKVRRSFSIYLSTNLHYDNESRSVDFATFQSASISARLDSSGR